MRAEVRVDGIRRRPEAEHPRGVGLELRRDVQRLDAAHEGDLRGRLVPLDVVRVLLELAEHDRAVAHRGSRWGA